ncbi:MAG TPA: universal stress protein [Streptosporangiaceae bacterium]|nr:universal stress protein [Streptosporangiaceae bacterium]
MGPQPTDGHIVVGVDGSAASLAALQWAGREAGLRSSALHVVHVWEDEARHWAPYASATFRRRRAGARQSAGARLEELAEAALGAHPEVNMVVEVADGLPARILLDRAARADLLVLGSPSDPAPDTLGPVAQVCLRHAPCPVVVVSVEKARGAAASPGNAASPHRNPVGATPVLA